MKIMTRQNILYAGLALGVLLALGFWVYLLFGPNPKTSRPSVVPITNSDSGEFNFPYQSALDGSGVMNKSDMNPVVVAVMIDNHPDAHPQYGLADARIVYEVPVEGSYTRFMALYAAGDQIGRAGPVRSARPYFISLAGEYGDPLYMHSGGSPDALDQLSKTDLVRDVNEFWNGDYFWRADDHDRPHNLFTNNSLWESWIQKNVSSTENAATYQSWNFVKSIDDWKNMGAIAPTATIQYAKDYVVTWEYDANRQAYARFENNVQELEGAKGLVRQATTVIVQYADVQTIDDYGRKAVTLTGQGKADVYVAGRVVHGTWSKLGPGRTKFLDSLGSPIPFPPGHVWVEVVAKDNGTTQKN